MTPEQILTLRTALQLSRAQLAAIVGVSTPSVARWERARVARCEPFQAQLLFALQTCADADAAGIQAHLKAAFLRGGLHPTHALLDWYFSRTLAPSQYQACLAPAPA